VINVTEKDHSNERRFARVIERKFKNVLSVDVGSFQADRTSRIDGVMNMEDGTTHLLELRGRERYDCERMSGMGPYINCHKAWPLIHDARSRGVSASFMVFCSDGFLVYNLYDHRTDTALDGTGVVHYDNPRRGVERGQSRNDSCFAIVLGKPDRIVKT